MGLLISFEGIDGCGKSTQIKLLHEKLNNNNIKTLIFREPGDTSFSNKIRDILLDNNNKICSASEMLLFLSARAQLVKEKIIPSFKEHRVVLLDRYIDSTVAYQGYGRMLNKTIINSLNMFAVNKAIPNLTFILNVDPKVCIDRIKNNHLDRIESAGYEFLKNVSDGYLEIASNDSERCKVINCNDKDILTIHDEIINIYNVYSREDMSI
tara:strand:+ start:130 stop:759 length:630 start_codon:yes stop_codon:yes gene_type:complete